MTLKRRYRTPLALTAALAAFLTLPGAAQSDTASNVISRPVVPTQNTRPPRRHTVEIFVTSWCPRCHELEAFLRDNNVPFIRFDVEHNSKGIEMYEALGGGGVPIIRIDGKKVIRGFFAEQLKRELEIGAQKPEVVVGAFDIEHARKLLH